MSSRMCLTANSTSLAGKCFWLRAIDSISSDFVMEYGPSSRGLPRTPSYNGRRLTSGVSLLLEQVSERRARRRSARVGLVVLHRLLLLRALPSP